MDKNDCLFSYKKLSKHKEILAFTTNKDSLSVTYPRFTGENPVVYHENRKELGKLLGINPNKLVFPRQTHSNNIKVIHQIPKVEMNDVDAMITKEPGICLCIQTADCVPILLFEPKEKVIAAVHAGWRGTVKKILAHTVLKMKEELLCNPKDIIAAIGPSICQEKYEVGQEVIKEVKEKLSNPELIIASSPRPGKAHVDLWEANKLQLLEAGLNEENIHVANLCSFTESNQFYSARRDGIDTGRMVSGIMLREG